VIQNAFGGIYSSTGYGRNRKLLKSLNQREEICKPMGSPRPVDGVSERAKILKRRKFPHDNFSGIHKQSGF
jgi:hypothetical protein